MRILHTSDWHLGKGLMGYSRAREHQAFCDEVVALAADVDLVLISGDVFDTYNPPIDAEEMLYDTLARLGDGGRRAVVVIAGNHDSPDRLAAPGPLSVTHGVFLFGRPGDRVARAGTRRGGVGVVQAGPSTLVLDLPAGQRACVAALPYPSEARLRTLLTPSAREGDLQRAYEDRLRAVFAQLAGCFQPDAVNLVTSHLTVSSCLPSESERTLVGGAYQVDPSVFPIGANYVALGHLHRPQDVPGSPVPTRYAGAPLAFRMSEGGVDRSHTLVEIDPGGPTRVAQVPVSAGRPLVVWEAAGGMAEVLAGVEQGLHRDAFVDLRVHVDASLDHGQLATLRKLPRDFVRIRAVLPGAAAADADAPHHALGAEELFRAFVREQTQAEPDDALVSLFLELSSAADAEVA